MRVVGIVIKEGKILLIHRIKESEDYFVFPGGAIESGEFVEEALKREIKEELSLVVVSSRKIFELDNLGNQETWYLVDKFSGNPELGGPEKERMNESNQYFLEWKSLEEIKSLNNLFPTEAKAKLLESAAL